MCGDICAGLCVTRLRKQTGAPSLKLQGRPLQPSAMGSTDENYIFGELLSIEVLCSAVVPHGKHCLRQYSSQQNYACFVP